jgi:hypothetical protein
MSFMTVFAVKVGLEEVPEVLQPVVLCSCLLAITEETEACHASYLVLLVDISNRDRKGISTRMGKKVRGLAVSTNEPEQFLPDARECVRAVVIIDRRIYSAIVHFEIPHSCTLKGGKFAWARLQGIL